MKLDQMVADRLGIWCPNHHLVTKRHNDWFWCPVCWEWVQLP